MLGKSVGGPRCREVLERSVVEKGLVQKCSGREVL